MSINRRALHRFRAKVRANPDTKCREWTAARTGGSDGKHYGAFRFNGKVGYAHRFAWEARRGPIPDGLTVDHLCRNTLCVFVRHLRLLPRHENAAWRAGVLKESAVSS